MVRLTDHVSCMDASVLWALHVTHNAFYYIVIVVVFGM